MSPFEMSKKWQWRPSQKGVATNPITNQRSPQISEEESQRLKHAAQDQSTVPKDQQGKLIFSDYKAWTLAKLRRERKQMVPPVLLFHTVKTLSTQTQTTLYTALASLPARQRPQPQKRKQTQTEFY